MAVLMAKKSAKYETVCDLHGHLTNLALVLQDDFAAVQLYERLQRTLFCEHLLAESRDYLCRGSYLETALDIDRAYYFFIHSWCGRNGTAGQKRMSFQIAVRYTPNGGSATTRFRSAIESIPAWHDRLRNVVILNRDALDVISKIPDEKGIAIYCDPPYLLSTRTGDNDGEYLHDFEELPELSSQRQLFKRSKDKHAILAEQLQRFKRARVVVSYYYHPRLETLYPGWGMRRLTATKNLANQNARENANPKPAAPEILIINGPSFGSK